MRCCARSPPPTSRTWCFRSRSSRTSSSPTTSRSAAMLNIVRRQLDRNWIFLLVCGVVLGGFEVLVCAMVASVDVEGAFGEITKFAPAVFRAMIEQTLMGGSRAAVVSFGWNHPVAHALLTAVAITLAARAIAGEVENGGIELVLAQPVSRARYFAAHVVFGIGALATVLAAGIMGTVMGQYAWSLEGFGPAKVAEPFVDAMALPLAVYAV